MVVVVKSHCRSWLGRVDRHVLALALLLVVSAGVRVRNVDINLPYYQHVDECTLLSQVLRMIRAGSANPHEFYKPSLPTYIITAALLTGDGIAVLTGEARGLHDLGVVGHGECQPYFPVPLAVALAKYVQGALSVCALGLLGFIAYLVTRQRVALWLAPLVACLSSAFTAHSWSYLNVDIPGAFFAFVTLAYVLHTHDAQGLPHAVPPTGRRALSFGVLAGLTVGSKYNLFPILVPCALWFWFHDRPHVLRRVLLLGLTSVVTFFATTPYAILSHREFLRYLDQQRRAYAQGIGSRHDVGRGLPALLSHVQTFHENFGWVSLAIALYGLVHLARRDSKTASLVFSYPVALVAFMSVQVLYFARNTVSVNLFIGLALCLGLLALFEQLTAWLGPRLAGFPRAVPTGVAGLLVLLVAVSTPWSAVGDAYFPEPDARVQAARWLRHELRPGATLLLERDSGLIDPRGLRKGVSVVAVPKPGSPRWKAWSKHKAPEGHGVALVRAKNAAAYAKALHGRVDPRRFWRRTSLNQRPNPRSGLALVYY